jgi:hypothetical protein
VFGYEVSSPLPLNLRSADEIKSRVCGDISHTGDYCAKF